MGGMRPDLTPPPKLSPGDHVAVLSPSFAAPAVFPAVHEQPAASPATGTLTHSYRL
jgi:hypothetical protein